jgi:uncharacterized DUF497 family protein
MDYVLTEHARDVLEKRQIPLAWVERAIDHPDWIEEDAVDEEIEHRLARIPEFGDRVLRVVINVKRTLPYIVTVFFDRRRRFP